MAKLTKSIYTCYSNLIQDNNALNDKIANEMKRIQLNKLHIEDYINKIEQLNIDIEVKI